MACAPSVASSEPPPTTPLQAIEYPAIAEPAPHSDTLLVMLPGYGSHADDFDKRGFVEAIRASGSDVDLIAVDATYTYYEARTLTERLRADVLEPARDAGYERIWIVGVSMGGLGALLTAKRHEDLVDGAIVFAPFLGTIPLFKEITAAGGVDDWQPLLEDGRWDVELWGWLKAWHDNKGDRGPELYLAYGTEDFGVRAHRLLAEAVGPDHVFTRRGGHMWGTWTPLWESVVEAAPWERGEARALPDGVHAAP